MNECIVFSAPEEVSVQEHPPPERGDDELLIETTHTLISTGTELTMLAGDVPDGSAWDEYSSYPVIAPGYCNVGRVVRSPSQSSFEDGDRVASWNGHAAHVTASPEACFRVPDGVSGDEAVFVAIAQIVMNGLRKGQVVWGETVGIYGLGLLGQFAARLCNIAGARPVLGLDISANRRSFLPDTASIAAYDPRESGWMEDARSSTSGRDADIIFEVTGNPAAITSEFDFLKEQGRLVLLSSPRGETNFDFHDYCNRHSYQIIGAHESSHPDVETPRTPWTKQRHAELYFKYLQESSLDVSQLITQQAGVDQAPEIYDQLLRDRESSLGIVFNW